jgi:GH24 family phage-related lysozyme (muramidase)
MDCSLGKATSKVPTSPVVELVRTQCDDLTALEAVVKELEETLAHVMSDPTPQEEVKETAVRSFCQFGMIVCSNNMIITRIKNRLRGIMVRLEV